MPRKRRIIVSSDEDEEEIPKPQSKKPAPSGKDDVGYMTRGFIGQLGKDVSQISTVVISSDEVLKCFIICLNPQIPGERKHAKANFSKSDRSR